MDIIQKYEDVEEDSPEMMEDAKQCFNFLLGYIEF